MPRSQTIFLKKIHIGYGAELPVKETPQIIDISTVQNGNKRWTHSRFFNYIALGIGNADVFALQDIVYNASNQITKILYPLNKSIQLYNADVHEMSLPQHI